jgi:NAD(P)-dependent dehydrogenase (short-subunit alcohol dehydrogenase family)
MSLTVDLAGRVALVTGGAKGLGAGISQALVEAGAVVHTCGRTSAAAVPGTTHHVCDVRDADAVEALLAGIGQLDVLVNNAGGSPYADAATASGTFHDRVIGLNLTAPLQLMQAARAAGVNAIVNISSVSATRPSPGTAAYGAAKAGLDSLTRSLAVEWAPVRVNSVDVGLCRTEHTEDHYGDAASVARVEATIPLGRMAEPREVGDLVAFLASDLASYVSGAVVACHGGGEPPVFLHAVKG